ncbi:hypothetical protein DY000_02058866 [Brassica cretica]|uniref:Clp1 P-loop domain-containing protein n=1 Tax=Brassica cretica TaxID=69181 RepID=A0ABQ7B2L3_BRACR|nr:hypothetical protein DY000_02058866 [Brassica cretica]
MGFLHLEGTQHRAAGMVINTMGGYDDVLLHAIETFNASVVLVLGQEKLYSKLKHVLSSKSNVDVVKLHKSGGVVAKNSEFRKTARSCRIQEYFDTTHSIYLGQFAWAS